MFPVPDRPYFEAPTLDFLWTKYLCKKIGPTFWKEIYTDV